MLKFINLIRVIWSIRNFFNKNEKIKNLLEWFGINAFIPFILPIIFLIVIRVLIKYEKNIGEILYELFLKGVYTFWGGTLMISLFQDYKVVPEAFKPYVYVFIFIELFIIGNIFLSSMDLLPDGIGVSFKENFDYLVVLTAVMLLQSVLFKYLLIKKHITKKKNEPDN